MKQRIYIDTSVYGGYFDDEFSEHTVPLFDRLRNDEFTLLFSTVTQEELEEAPINVKELVRNLRNESTRYIELTDEAVALATAYITERVVGPTSYADCLHIALATNIKNGYSQLDIRSPREFEKYEDD